MPLDDMSAYKFPGSKSTKKEKSAWELKPEKQISLAGFDAANEKSDRAEERRAERQRRREAARVHRLE